MRCSILSLHELSHRDGWKQSTEQKVLPAERKCMKIEGRKIQNQKCSVSLSRQGKCEEDQNKCISPERYSAC